MAECEKGKEVKVVCTDGQQIAGRCWAYGVVQAEEEYDVAEPFLDIGPGIIVFSSEIEKIDFVE